MRPKQLTHKLLSALKTKKGTKILVPFLNSISVVFPRKSYEFIEFILIFQEGESHMLYPHTLLYRQDIL